MKKEILPGKEAFGRGSSGGTHRTTPVKGQMTCGTPAKLQSRAGTFSGTPSDIRSKSGRFSGGAARQQRLAGGQHNAHASQPSGHGKQPSFASTAHKGHTK